jgi:hypothetical protein
MPLQSLVREKVREWFLRYMPAELVAIVAAYVGFYWVWSMQENTVLASYAAALGETTSFYLVMFFREYRIRLARARANNSLYGFKDFIAMTTHLCMEFGLSELVDGFFIRPLVLGIATSLCGMQWGILVGKLLADISFYIPVIFLYEYNKRKQVSTLRYDEAL